jgi:hypothetical protein
MNKTEFEVLKKIASDIEGIKNILDNTTGDKNGMRIPNEKETEKMYSVGAK